MVSRAHEHLVSTGAPVLIAVLKQASKSLLRVGEDRE